jgi:hypothetical protein
MSDRSFDPRGHRVEVNPLQAEQVLKNIMTKVWIAKSGRISAEECVDEAFRIAKQTMGLVAPPEWRDRFVKAAQAVLDAREHAPAPQMEVVVTDESKEDFEERVRAVGGQHPVKVVVNPSKE